MKYKALLEGLEVSEVSLSIVLEQNRADSDFYKKKFIETEQKICNMDNAKLSDVASFLIGPFGSSFDTKNYLENGRYRYVRGQDVKPFILREDDNKYIPEADFIRLSKYALKTGDILLSVVGTIGNACIVQEKNLPAIFSCKSTVIRTGKLPSAYILTWLNCIYGKQLLYRRERGAIQKGLNLEDLKSLPIPLFEDSLYKKIEGYVSKAIDNSDLSKCLYSEAESYLLECLGMTDFAANPDAYNVKTLKKSFLETGRFDAEYYLPKYEDYCRLVQSYANGFCHISDCFSHVTNRFSPNKGETYRYIEIGDVDVSNGEIAYKDVEDCALPANAKISVRDGDLLISTVRPNRGAVAIINRIDDKMVVSGAFTVLRETSGIKKEVLYALLRTSIYKDWLLQSNTGCSYPVIRDEDILNMPIPIIRQEVQEEIARHVQRSFSLRKEAIQLLENAKLTVEQVIEKWGGGVIY